MSSDTHFAEADGELAPHVLIAGAGYCGSALVRRLDAGESGRPYPVPRSWRVGTPLVTPPGPFDVVWLVPPTDPGRVGEHLQDLQQRGARRAIYVSSTSVYGAGGGVLDHDSPRRPTTARGRARVAEEDQFLTRGASVVRLPGIYGPGRSIFDRLGPEYRLVEGGSKWSARIHRDDVAMGLEIVLRHGEGAYVLTDGVPFQVRDLVRFACQLTGRGVPESESLEDYTARRGEFAASFWVHSNRYDPSGIASLPGFGLKYPSWREGLRDIHRVVHNTDDGSGPSGNEER